MPNIVLTRIDNRLVHGQVATQWCGSIGANLILVANDKVAGDKLRQGLADHIVFFKIAFGDHWRRRLLTCQLGHLDRDLL